VLRSIVHLVTGHCDRVMGHLRPCHGASFTKSRSGVNHVTENCGETARANAGALVHPEPSRLSFTSWLGSSTTSRLPRAFGSCYRSYAMWRAPLRYIVALLLGIAVGRFCSQLQDNAREGNGGFSYALDSKRNVDDPKEVPRYSMGEVLDLAKPGGGLQQDAALEEALKTMRAEDFRGAASLWTTEMQGRLQRDTVRARAILDRWFELDPDSAKSFAVKACTPAQNEPFSAQVVFRQTIAESAGHSDPEWALNHLLFDRPNSPWFNPNVNLMAEVVGKDPALAKDWLQRMEKSNLRNSILAGYVRGLARSDPLAALDLAIAEKGFERVNLIPESVRAAASQGRGMALEALGKIDDLSLRRRAAFEAMQVLARETTTPPFEFLEGAIGRDNLAAMQIDSVNKFDAVEANPMAAARWAIGLPDESRSVFLNWIVKSWQRIDSKGAIEWMQQNAAISGGPEENSVKSLAAVLLAERLVANGQITEAMTALSQTTEAGMSFENVSSKIVEDNPEEAARWAASMPEGKAREIATARVAQTWVVRDPEAAAKWVEKLPSGATRNEALVGMIYGIIEIDPEGASRWAPLITDPKQRTTSIERIYSAWYRRDPAAGLEWVRNLPNVDERWRAKFLRRYR
jgi:hypothetical protein